MSQRPEDVQSAATDALRDATDEDADEDNSGGEGSGQGLVDAAGDVAAGVGDVVSGAADTAERIRDNASSDGGTAADATDAYEDATGSEDTDRRRSNYVASESGGSGPETSEETQQNIDAALADNVDRVRREQQGVEQGSGRVAEQAREFEQRVAVEQGLNQSDIAVRRAGDELRVDATPTGTETLQRRYRSQARDRARVAAGLETAADVAGGFARAVDSADTMAAAGGVALAQEAAGLLTGGSDGEATRSQSFEQGQRRARRVARRADETAVQPDVNVSDLPSGVRGSVRAIDRSQTRGVAASAQRSGGPRDLGDQYVPDYIEDPVNDARDTLAAAGAGAADVAGDVTGPVPQYAVVPTGDGVGAIGGADESGAPTSVQQGVGDLIAAPGDTAVAGIEAAEAATYAVGGSRLAGGSNEEQRQRLEDVAEETERVGRSAYRSFREDPARFATSAAAESLVAGGIASRVGGPRTGVGSSIEQTIRTGRRAGRLAETPDVGGSVSRAARTASEVRARAPSVEITRDADAGLVDYQGLVTRADPVGGGGGRLPSFDSLRDVSRPDIRPERIQRRVSDFGTDARYSLGEARRRAGEAIAPEPRRGSGEFAVDADVTGGSQLVDDIADLRERTAQRVGTELASADLSGRRAVDRLRSAGASARDRLTPTPRRGGEFAVDADVTGGRVTDALTDPQSTVGGALAGGAASADLALQRAGAAARATRSRVGEALTPTPRGGSGDFAVDARVTRGTRFEGLLPSRDGNGSLTPDFERAARRGRQLGRAAIDRATLDRPAFLDAPEGNVPDATGAGSLGFFVNEARRRFDERFAPSPRRGGDFAVDASTGLSNPLAGISDTTIRIRPGRPPRQTRTLSADAFAEADADGTPVFGFEESDGDLPEDFGTGDVGGRIETSQSEVDVGGGQVAVREIDTRRTGTGTDALARSDTLDARTPTVGPVVPPRSTRSISPEAATDPNVDLGEADAIGGTGAGTGTGSGLQTGAVTGPTLDADVGQVTTPDVSLDQRQELRPRTREPGIGRNPGTRITEDTDTDQRTRVDVRQEERQEQRLRLRTDTDSRIRPPDLPESNRETEPVASPAPAESTSGGEGDPFFGYFAETVADYQSGGVASADDLTVSEAQLTAAQAEGYASFELPTGVQLDDGDGGGGIFDLGGGRG